MAENLRAMADEFEVSETPSDGKPWTVVEQLEMHAGQFAAQAEWAERLVARYERGDVPTHKRK